MVGILVYIVIGFFLFTPIGYLAAYYQFKHKNKSEAQKDEDYSIDSDRPI